MRLMFAQRKKSLVWPMLPGHGYPVWCVGDPAAVCSRTSRSCANYSFGVHPADTYDTVTARSQYCIIAVIVRAKCNACL